MTNRLSFAPQCVVRVRKGMLASWVLLAMIGVAGSARASTPVLTEFDVPGAGVDVQQGTYPLGINPAGVIVGYYVDASDICHGFVRLTDGTITTFDAPGASTVETTAQAINPSGTVTGFFQDTNNVY